MDFHFLNSVTLFWPDRATSYSFFILWIFLRPESHSCCPRACLPESNVNSSKAEKCPRAQVQRCMNCEDSLNQ